MLHEFLTEHRDEIVSRCERKLRARHPDRPADEAVDSIPQFIDELIKAERREGGIDEPSELPTNAPYAKEHGAQRFPKGFDITDIAMDYGVISDTIGDLAMEHHAMLDPRSYKLLNECIDMGIAKSIEEYFALDRAAREEDITQWVGSLSHELRNALGSAMMAFNVLKTGRVGTESRTARVLERSLHRLEELLKETITATQIRVRKQLSRQRVYLRELVEEIIGGLPKDGRVSAHNLVEHALYLEVDPNPFESALSNVILNAVKYTRDGGHVEVRAMSMIDAFLIEVEDECGGLGTKHPDQMFKAFSQGQSDMGGMGLGLTIAREAIEAHGGEISVRDLAPKGCVFTIRIPR